MPNSGVAIEKTVRRSSRTNPRGNRRQKKADIEKEIKKIEAAISLTAKQQAAVEEDVTRLRKEADRFGTSSIEMQMRRADIRNKQKALDTLAAELDTLRMEAKNPPRVVA